jgi:DNA-binding NarL/FixJ family response regulator
MAEPEKIRILIADDHRLFRDALKSILHDQFTVVGEADNGEDAVALTIDRRPHVVLLDLSMGGIGGIAAAHRIAKEAPNARVLVLSQYNDEEYVLEALGEARAAGYVLKTDAAAELLTAIRAVHSGRQYLSPSVAPIVLGRLRRNPNGAAIEPEPLLTPREREVLRLIGEGATSKEIASRLKISPKTAQAHRENLKNKLDLRTTAAMVRYAIKHKLIRID